MMITYHPFRLALGAGPLVLAFVALLAGCDIFGAESPGVIRDDDLDDPRSVGPLVTGMSADVSNFLDDAAFLIARLTDEMTASGSYFLSGQVRRGFLDPDDVDTYWEAAQKARFAAESGLVRMQTLLGEEFDGNELTARAYLFAGLSNRMLGENFCRVAYDSSAAQPTSVAFERAIAALTTAIEQAEQTIEQAEQTGAETEEAEDLLLAAYGGRAQAYVGLGDWDQAVADAQQIPTGFAYDALYSDNTVREQNEIYDETHQRYEMSAYGTLAQGPAELIGDDSLGVVPGSLRDPRAPYTDCRGNTNCTAQVGADGATPHLRQEKYDELGTDIPLVKGTEMRLIEAEAALVAGDLGAALAAMNEARAFYELDPIPASAVTAIGETGPDGFADGTAYALLDQERFLTLWLEARRLHDLRRWDHPYLYRDGFVYDSRVTKRPACIPISESECDTNPNVTCEVPYVD